MYVLADTMGYVFGKILYSAKPMKYDAKGILFGKIFALLTSEGLEGPGKLHGVNYLNKGHHLFIDNLYTEVPTLVALQKLKTFIVGTLRRNKSFLPNPLIVTKQAHVQSAMLKTHPVHFYCAKLLHMLTNYITLLHTSLCAKQLQRLRFSVLRGKP